MLDRMFISEETNALKSDKDSVAEGKGISSLFDMISF